MQIESKSVPPAAAAAEVEEPRSGYGSRPGGEFPAGVYMSVIGAFVWMIGMAWVAFASRDGTDLDLLVVTRSRACSSPYH
jgi:hypothetical protein